jgi:hypothetical protein
MRLMAASLVSLGLAALELEALEMEALELGAPDSGPPPGPPSSDHQPKRPQRALSPKGAIIEYDRATLL